MSQQRAVAVPPDVTLHGPSVREVRVAARARFTVDASDLLGQLEKALWAAANPESITDERVFAYCESRGRLHPRLELALLRTAQQVVSPADVIDRLLADTGHYLQRGNGEITLVVSDAHLSVGADVEGTCTASGILSLTGTLTLSHGARHAAAYNLETNWRVSRGEPRRAFVDRASTLFAEPLARVVGSVAARALADADRAVPLVMRAALQSPSTPALVKLERLLRAGRLTDQTRVARLYSQRFRDYLAWSVTQGVSLNAGFAR